MTEYKDIIGIKIPKNAPSVTVLKIILNNYYVFTCDYDYIHDKGLNNVFALYDELNKVKIKPTIYKRGNKITLTFLKDLAESYEETKRYTEYIMDQESGDSEFETYEEFLSHYEDEDEEF